MVMPFNKIREPEGTKLFGQETWKGCYIRGHMIYFPSDINSNCLHRRWGEKNGSSIVGPLFAAILESLLISRLHGVISFVTAICEDVHGCTAVG